MSQQSKQTHSRRPTHKHQRFSIQAVADIARSGGKTTVGASHLAEEAQCESDEALEVVLVKPPARHGITEWPHISREVSRPPQERGRRRVASSCDDDLCSCQAHAAKHWTFQRRRPEDEVAALSASHAMGLAHSLERTRCGAGIRVTIRMRVTPWRTHCGPGRWRWPPAGAASPS